MRKTALNTIFEIAKENEKILFIGSDLGQGVLSDMKKSLPSRFFMEGVCEQNIIGMSAGLAMEGFIPYVNTIGTFLTRRCYEQIVVDLCLHNLPVRLISNGGGAVYAPLGPTHLAVEDFAILRVLPNMTIISPCDSIEMKKVIRSSLDWPNPIYIRLAKGGDKIITDEETNFKIGKAVIIKEPGNGLFITTGVMTQMALSATEELEKIGYKIGIIHFHTIKPLDGDILKKILPNVKSIITVEEHFRVGGLGTSILEFCNDELPSEIHKIKRIGIPNSFAEEYGSQETLLNHWNINEKTLIKNMLEELRNKND